MSDLNIFHNTRLKRVLDGTRRLGGEVDIRERHINTKDILLQILSHFNPSVKQNIGIQATFCLVFAALLRVSEFTYKSKYIRNEDFDS